MEEERAATNEKLMWQRKKNERKQTHDGGSTPHASVTA